MKNYNILNNIIYLIVVWFFMIVQFFCESRNFEFLINGIFVNEW